MNWCLNVAFLFTQLTTLAVEKGERTIHVKPGDIVKAVAPAWKESDSHLPLIKSYIESLGLIANISQNVFSNVDPIYANSDEFRANDLVSALLDDNIKVIWGIHGGSGCSRIIPLLEDKLPATLRQKIFIGISDLTALHLYFQYKYGWQTIHVGGYIFNARNGLKILLQGMLLDDIASGFYTPSSATAVTTVDFIFGRRNKLCLPVTKLNDIHVTRIESKVVGGNAATVELSIGTVWELYPKGNFFFLEDIGDFALHIEKRLDHMKQSKTFDGVDAVIFGDFSETDNDDLVDFVLERFAQSVPFPVFRVTGIGHGEINYPLPLRTQSVISSVDGGVTYEFCVDNIQNSSSKDVHLSSKSIFLTIIIIGVYFSFH